MACVQLDLRIDEEYLIESFLRAKDHELSHQKLNFGPMHECSPF